MFTRKNVSKMIKIKYLLLNKVFYKNSVIEVSIQLVDYKKL